MHPIVSASGKPGGAEAEGTESLLVGEYFWGEVWDGDREIFMASRIGVYLPTFFQSEQLTILAIGDLSKEALPTPLVARLDSQILPRWH